MESMVNGMVTSYLLFVVWLAQQTNPSSRVGLGHTEMSESDREYGKQRGHVLLTFCCLDLGRRWS